MDIFRSAPLCFAADFFVFFQCLISVDRHQILDTCSMVTQIYKIGSEIWGHSHTEIGGPKTSKFGLNFGQLGKLIANISGKKQDIVQRKTALQSTICPAYKYLIW